MWSARCTIHCGSPRNGPLWTTSPAAGSVSRSRPAGTPTDFALRPENYADRRTILVRHASRPYASCGAARAIADRRRRRQAGELAHLPAAGAAGAAGVDHQRGRGRNLPQRRRAGAGLLTHLLGQDLADLAEKIAEYRAAVGPPDADGWPGHVVLMVHTYLGNDEDEARETVRGPLSTTYAARSDLLLGSQLDGARKVDLAKLGPRRTWTSWCSGRSTATTTTAACSGPSTKADTVRRATDIGVDEIACLIDFGVDTKAVLAGLDHLNELRVRASEKYWK